MDDSTAPPQENVVFHTDVKGPLAGFAGIATLVLLIPLMVLDGVWMLTAAGVSWVQAKYYSKYKCN